MSTEQSPAERKANLADRQARGAEADGVLNSRIIKEAFEEIRAETLEQWESTKIDQVDVREDAFRMLKAVKVFEGKLRAWVRDGKGAGDDLARMKDEEKGQHE